MSGIIGMDPRSRYWAFRNKLTGGGGGGGGGGYASYDQGAGGSSSSYQAYEPPAIDPITHTAGQISAMQTILAAQLAGLPQETQAKYNEVGSMLLGNWAPGAMKKNNATSWKDFPKPPSFGRGLM